MKEGECRITSGGIWAVSRIFFATFDKVVQKLCKSKFHECTYILGGRFMFEKTSSDTTMAILVRTFNIQPGTICSSINVPLHPQLINIIPLHALVIILRASNHCKCGLVRVRANYLWSFWESHRFFLQSQFFLCYN